MAIPQANEWPLRPFKYSTTGPKLSGPILVRVSWFPVEGMSKLGLTRFETMQIADVRAVREKYGLRLPADVLPWWVESETGGQREWG
jgi:hypothetical protein